MPRKAEIAKARRERAKLALVYVKTKTELDYKDPAVQKTILALADGGWLQRPANYRPPARATARLAKQLVDATGTIRRLKGLAVEGWTPLAIGAEIGVSQNSLKAIRAGQQSSVPAGLAEAVRWLAESERDIPQLRPASISRTINHAKAEGWFRLEAWEGLDIDDPAVQPFVSAV